MFLQVAIYVLDGAWGYPHRREGFFNEKSFSKVGKEHGRTHTGEKSFECTKCDNIKSLEKLWDNPLKREAFHMLEVWQELLKVRPLKDPWEDPHRREAFKCSKCDKSFSKLDHFKKHEQTHTVEKLFKCKLWMEMIRIEACSWYITAYLKICKLWCLIIVLFLRHNRVCIASSLLLVY